MVAKLHSILYSKEPGNIDLEVFRGSSDVDLLPEMLIPVNTSEIHDAI